MDANKLASRPVVSDAKRALSILRQELKEAGYKGTQAAYRSEIQNLKEDWDAKVTELRTPQEGSLGELAVIGLVNETVGGRATMVCASGGMPGEVLRLWRPEDPKAYHLEYGYSCMGYEIPGGIGVKLAEPEREGRAKSTIATGVTHGLVLILKAFSRNSVGVFWKSTGTTFRRSFRR